MLRTHYLTFEQRFCHQPTAPRWKRMLNESTTFLLKQTLSAVFPVFIFLCLWLSQQVRPDFIHRYDLLLLLCLAMQIFMYATRMETRDELLAICVFHAIGFSLEVFKVNQGSWSYPEAAATKIYGVPLYSGFMYASVASYIMQAWRRFGVKLIAWPTRIFPIVIAALIHLNFIFNAWLPDHRWYLLPVVAIVFFFTKVTFTTNGSRRTVPLLLVFVAIGCGIWLAENISTLLGAWQYPHQLEQWQAVGLGKFSSWFFMVIVSVVVVVEMKLIKKQHQLSEPAVEQPPISSYF